MINTLITIHPEAAAKVIESEGIVIFPTETVYGIGASAFLHDSCRRIYSIKNRPEDNPLIIHVHTPELIPEMGYFPDFAQVLLGQSEHPLTFILRKKNNNLFSGNLDTIAIRSPHMPLAKKFLQHSGPVSAPSANISGKPSITGFTDAVEIFNGKVDCILQGDDSSIGLESTIIDLTRDIPLYARPGSFSFEKIRQILPTIVRHGDKTQTNVIPGLKYKHYAPDAKIVLIENCQEVESKLNSAYIGFDKCNNTSESLYLKNNREYMHFLYRFFIDCDRKKMEVIYCQYPKEDEFQEALLNRLQKAAQGK